jgi:hypothetical protein
MHAVVKGLVYGGEDVWWVQEYGMDWGNKPLSLLSSFRFWYCVKESCMYRKPCQLCRIITYKKNSAGPLASLVMEGILSCVNSK